MRDLLVDPLRMGQPRQIVGLRVVIGGLNVRAVRHLFDQRPRDAVAFRAEGHRPLLVANHSIANSITKQLIDSSIYRRFNDCT